MKAGALILVELHERLYNSAMVELAETCSEGLYYLLI